MPGWRPTVIAHPSKTFPLTYTHQLRARRRVTARHIPRRPQMHVSTQATVMTSALVITAPAYMTTSGALAAGFEVRTELYAEFGVRTSTKFCYSCLKYRTDLHMLNKAGPRTGGASYASGAPRPVRILHLLHECMVRPADSEQKLEIDARLYIAKNAG